METSQEQRGKEMVTFQQYIDMIELNRNRKSNEKLAEVLDIQVSAHKAELMNYYFGINTEAGEFGDLLKKHFFHAGKYITRERMVDELGDVLWYAIAYMIVCGSTVLHTFMEHFKIAYGRIEDPRHKDSHAGAAEELGNLINRACDNGNFSYVRLAILMKLANLVYKDITLEEIWNHNYYKLTERHGAGGFENSKNK